MDKVDLKHFDENDFMMFAGIESEDPQIASIELNSVKGHYVGSVILDGNLFLSLKAKMWVELLYWLILIQKLS